MRILLVGGAYQGKRAYAVDDLTVAEHEILDGGEASPDAIPAARCLNGLHRLVRGLMERGQDPADAILTALDVREDWVVLCDEVGAGVVPIDQTDRLWREEVGRLCVELARRADRVERIVCGLPQRLKG